MQNVASSNGFTSAHSHSKNKTLYQDIFLQGVCAIGYFPLYKFKKFYFSLYKAITSKKIDRIRSGPKLTWPSSSRFPEPRFSRDAVVGSHARPPAPHMQDC